MPVAMSAATIQEVSAENVPAPRVSVVIASRNGPLLIDACLASLARQTGNVEFEVVVADCVGQSVADLVKSKYPSVRLIGFAERKSVPQLRAAGLFAARGDIVAITSDSCLVPANWCESIVLSHTANPSPAIGGAVDPSDAASPAGWAAYFCEYSNFTSPVPRGAVRDLPGPNVSYKRSALERLRGDIAPGYLETSVHRQLTAAGCQLWSDPSIIVHCEQRFGLLECLFSRFHYGRWYAGIRGLSAGLFRRLAYSLLSPLLPLVLLVRIARRVLSRGRYAREFTVALPYLFLLTLAWASGELVGGLLGAGESALEIY